MNNLSEFIKKERERKEIENPQPIQSPTNVRSSLLALKNAVDGFGSLEGNPIIENIKKVETVVERKDQGFIQPTVGTKPQSSRQPILENNVSYNEKDDQFTKDLLMKTRQFITGSGTNPITQPVIKEEIYHPQPVQPDYRYNHVNPSNFNTPNQVSKNDVLTALKDTITDLYVKERVESVIREYLQTDEGKMLIKSIVVGLFKKK
jgi:hypothetical protein